MPTDARQHAPSPTIERIAARRAEIGGSITVQRVLPVRERRTIGAWCFLDHAGPALFKAGGGMRVGAHPHIGLQTFTWLIEGEVLHRDSLGNAQVIRPGQVNLMTAGHGIAHSEESLPGERRLHAAQLWIALPESVADCAPAFEHYPTLPVWDQGGCHLTLLAGSYAGHTAPTRLYSPLVGIDLFSPQGAAIELPLDPAFEYGILPLTGGIHLGGQHFAANEMAYLGCGRQAVGLDLAPDTRLLLIGGEPQREEIIIWWNFVGHSKAGIAQAQRDWENDKNGENNGNQRFGRVIGYEGESLKAPSLPWAGF
jgi:redox-sensitive bicupin YhaK (pirin superfamily)